MKVLNSEAPICRVSSVLAHGVMHRRMLRASHLHPAAADFNPHDTSNGSRGFC
jgi:hypothetical protein